jgi:hypothetical protein
MFEQYCRDRRPGCSFTPTSSDQRYAFLRLKGKGLVTLRGTNEFLLTPAAIQNCESWEDPSAAENTERRVSSHQRPPGTETSYMPDPRKVFVIHGRDGAARTAVFNFLRALKLEPMEWNEVVALTGKASPYIGEVIEAGFANAQAIVVVFSGDDEAQLRADLRKANEPEYETKLSLQPRQNVLFGVDPLSLSPPRCGRRIHGCDVSSRRTHLSSVLGSSSSSGQAGRWPASRRSSASPT